MSALAQHTELIAASADGGTTYAMSLGTALPLVAYAALVLAALITIVTSRHEFGMKIVWTVFVFVAPFVGSVLWFVVGRGHQRSMVVH